MKRFALVFLIALFPIIGHAQSAREQLENIAGSSISATRADNEYEARSRAAKGWGEGGVSAWKDNRRDAWEYRKAARERIRRQRREARTNRRRYHLRDYQPSRGNNR